MLQVGTYVFDRWWPWRLGHLSRRTKSTATVEWDDGTAWTYDRAHLQFLERSRAVKTNKKLARPPVKPKK